ncbi:MAG TPA: NAD-dependent epimerase/dehydratase family protein [bacterium]|uniref:UDP-glucose 4-epimerase n=1 Tax=candidate division TA06 bacterium ADurb.Bin417 TaxID=1852828 RepID=A0A1V5MIJ8_UNCT6|nr:MAG: UDP-glucose 4-epimerase [candidate division TA06 bacterium ADurb.Bin417]HNQ35290.1 NAD-dependent epimerase/dehydratase family protein [bacterium]HNS48407.1 NAD-dependent epimerase/dehydratase family protein [bacterium]
MAEYLVTGGAGFIGSHLVERLVREGGSVRVLDNFSSGRESNLAGVAGPGVEVLRGDICDQAACAEACRGVSYVVHLAALRSVPRSMADPYSYNRVNIDGSLNMMFAARAAGVRQFALASSSSVYGEAERFPQSEAQLPALISPYALSKLAGEHYGYIFTRQFGLPVTCLRYFNVFGERQSLEDEYAVVIPKFITCMLKGERPPVHGDGTQSRDFTPVENVAEATLLAVRNPAAAGLVFNVGCGREHSILNLVAELNRILGSNLEPLFTPVRPGDVMRTLADIGRARRVLGYEPRVSFADGLARTVEYFKKTLA